MLTGKAKTDFEKWLHSDQLSSDTFESLSGPEVFYFVIRWLDSVFIVLTINNEYYDGFHFYWKINMAKPYTSDEGFETRELATISAITKANEIYNSK